MATTKFAAVRAIDGWALQTYQAPIDFRGIDGWALTNSVLRKPADLTAPLSTSLITAINREYGLALKVDDFVFDAFQTLTDNEFNTSIKITAKPSSGYSGSKVFRYNRLNLVELVYYSVDNRVKVVDGATDTLGYLNAINTAFGLSLTAADIDNQPLVYDNDDNMTLLVKAKSSSAYWVGESNLPIQNYPLIATAFSGDTLSTY